MVRLSVRSVAAGAIALAAVTLTLAACSASSADSVAPTGSPPTATATAAEIASPSSVDVTSAPSSIEPSQVIAADPPTAALAAEGGDPTVGQLGTYTWGNGGSDSPWLPGARIAVGAGEPLTVTLKPETAVASWTARYVPSTAGGPAGATALGDGSGQPRFTAPGAGTWTVEVHVTFANDLGSASYFWQLAVD